MDIKSVSSNLVCNASQILKTNTHRLIILALAAVMMISLPVTAQANPKYAGIVIDAKTGRTLYKYKADSKRYPASLTKMMTLYLVFEALERGKIKKSTRIRVSKNAAAEVPSKIGVRAGQYRAP